MAQIVIPSKPRKSQDWPSLGVINPGKGLNNLVSDEYIDNDEASALENIQYLELGNPAKRNGRSVVGTGLVSNPKGLASYYTTSSKYLLTIDGTSLKYLTGGVFTAISGVTFTAGKNTTFCQARGDLYIWNGFDAGAKLDSSLSLTQPGTMPSAAFSLFYSGRQYAAGTSAQQSRLYASNSGNMGDFTVATGGTPPQPDNSTDVPGASVFAGTPGGAEAFFIDISKDDGDKITGLAKFQEQLIVFKERSTWSLTLDATGLPVLKQVSNSLGCISHRSIDNVENDVYFLSRRGYYTLGNQANFFDSIRTNEFSARIHPTIETITPSNLANTCSIFSGYVFLSSVSTGGTTTNNKTVTYDTRYQAWSLWTNINANAFTEFIDSNNVKHLYYAADDEAKIYELDQSYSDNGQAINAGWTSKALNFGDFSLMKQILYIDFEFRQLAGSVTVDVITDGNVLASSKSIGSSYDTVGTFGDEVWNTPLWGGSVSTATMTSSGLQTSNVPYRLPVNKTTKTLKVRVSNKNNNESFIFLGFKAYYRLYNVQKFDSRYKLTGSTASGGNTGGLVADTGEFLTEG